jgi:shikimate dehydrogenase
MKKFGLTGYPLSHSFSVSYFSSRFENEHLDQLYSYQLFELKDISSLPALLKNERELIGLNVTIPHKVSVMNLLNELDESAIEAQAVNTICIFRDPDGNVLKTKGYNTDLTGFRESLLNLIGESRPEALLLGTGGASKAVSAVLRQLGIEFIQVSRFTGANTITYKDINEKIITEYPLVINTTSLGMYPEVMSKPILPYSRIGKNNILFDLVYNPPVSAFLNEGLKVGATIKNGYEMLTIQAEASWKIWQKELL